MDGPLQLWPLIKNNPLSHFLISYQKCEFSWQKWTKFEKNKVLEKLKLPKNVNNKKHDPEMIFFNIFFWKIRVIFDIEDFESQK